MHNAETARRMTPNTKCTVLVLLSLVYAGAGAEASSSSEPNHCGNLIRTCLLNDKADHIRFREYPTSSNFSLRPFTADASFDCRVRVRNRYSACDEFEEDIYWQIVWRINSSNYFANQAELDHLYRESSITVTTDSYCDLLCSSTLKIPITATNNNTIISCGLRPNNCSVAILHLNEVEGHLPANATLLVQGPLSAPGNITVSELNTTTLQLSWIPPFTLAGVAIQYYSVSVSDGSQSLVHNQNVTHSPCFISVNVANFCSCIQIEVRAWNDLEGEPGVILYSQDTLTLAGIHVVEIHPGLLCGTCHFSTCGSSAAISNCNMAVQTTFGPPNVQVISISGLQGFHVHTRCIGELESNSYMVYIQETKCGGQIHGDRVFEFTNVSVQGITGPVVSMLPKTSFQLAMDSASGLVAGIAVLGVCLAGTLVLIIFLLLMFCVQRKKGSTKSSVAVVNMIMHGEGPDEEQNTYEDVTPAEDCMYDAINTHPRSEDGHGAGQAPGPGMRQEPLEANTGQHDMDIATETCIAYSIHAQAKPQST